MIEDAIKYAQFLAYCAAAFGVIFTSINYFNSLKVKRGEWIKSLFEKFYEQDRFKKIRKEIEYEKLRSFLAIDGKGRACNEENEELLVDYLNFFELLATLIKNKHIRRSEVLDLFSYYFNLLKTDIFIRRYVEQFGFKNLNALLNERER